jgi:hypothetical protein
MAHKGQVYAKTRLVQGVGVNDAPFSIGGQSNRNPVYEMWKRMLARCYGKTNSSNASYVGCEVDSRWHRFMAFHDWVIARDWEGKQLEKDLLVSGNKIYGPETCCLVPGYVNMIFVKTNQPCIQEYRPGRFIALVCKRGKKVCLGTFPSKELALAAWKAGKRDSIQDVLSRYEAEPNPDLRVIEALKRSIN